MPRARRNSRKAVARAGFDFVVLKNIEMIGSPFLQGRRVSPGPGGSRRSRPRLRVRAARYSRAMLAGVRSTSEARSSARSRIAACRLSSREFNPQLTISPSGRGRDRAAGSMRSKMLVVAGEHRAAVAQAAEHFRGKEADRRRPRRRFPPPVLEARSQRLRGVFDHRQSCAAPRSAQRVHVGTCGRSNASAGCARVRGVMAALDRGGIDKMIQDGRIRPEPASRPLK